MGLRSRRLLDRKTKNRKQDGILKISVEDFPQEIAHYIFAKLPLLSLLEAKLVCKSWYYLATHPQLTSLYHLNDTNPNCLIILPKTHDKDCPNRKNSSSLPNTSIEFITKPKWFITKSIQFIKSNLTSYSNFIIN